MTEPARNDPCPCGSGLKYKKCCLRADADRDLEVRRFQRLHGEFPARLLEFGVEVFGDRGLDSAWKQFCLWDPDPGPFEFGGPYATAFMPWMLFHWRPDHADDDLPADAPVGCTIAELYLEHNRERLTGPERWYLEVQGRSRFSFHDVVAVDPGQGMRLRDILLGDVFEVLERSASSICEVGDVLFASVSHLETANLIDGIAGVRFGAFDKAPILDLRKKIRSQIHEPGVEDLDDWELELLEIYHDLMGRALDQSMPEIRNTDGEPLCMQTVNFAIDSPRAAFDALKDLAIGQSEDDLLDDARFDRKGELVEIHFPWLVAGNRQHEHWDNTVLGHLSIDGKLLSAAVNSDNRADRIRELVEQRLGNGGRYVDTWFDDESMHDDPDEPDFAGPGPELQDFGKDPEMLAEVERMFHQHYAGWHDEKLPVLDGRTPAEAVTDPEGRELVRGMLDAMDREIQSAMPWLESSPINDLRKRLKLDRQ